MKLHWCCGDIYLKGYCNIDIDGILIQDASEEQIKANETDLKNYFKYPFIRNIEERKKTKRSFIIDLKLNILKKWPFPDNSIEEVVMISCIEHFDPVYELTHILEELNRVIKIGGRLVIDFPDIKGQVEKFYGSDPDFCMELIYCNHKHKYAIHHWGFTEKTFPTYLGKNWSYDFKEVVKHEYPMIGCEATKQEECD